MAIYRLTDGNDTRTGSADGDVFDAYSGDDGLGAAGGTDSLIGGAGNDSFLLGEPTALPNGGLFDGGADTDTVHAYGYDLGTFMFRNVEILSLHYAEFSIGIRQLNAFSTITATLPATAPITFYLQGAGGLLNFNGKVADGRGVNLNGASLSSGLNAAGTAAADEMRGSQYADTLRGGGGADIFLAQFLDGSQSGVDSLYGDGGNDTFYVRRQSGVVDGGTGTDTLIAYQFSTGFGDDIFGHLGDATFVNIERLVTGERTTLAHVDQINSFSRISAESGEQAVKLYLVGAGGTIDFSSKITVADQVLWLRAYEATSAIDILGTARADAIIGSDFNDRLDGGAGADELAGADFVSGAMGRDTLIGGEGNDTFYADGTDTIIESVYGFEGGVDTVRSFTSFDLANPRVQGEVENLTLLGYLGNETKATNGFGNGMANVIIGHDGANRIDGRGGADTMIGGDGDDVYFVDNIDDLVREVYDEGNDTIYATVSFDLTMNSIGEHYVEQLVLQGSNAIDAYGSELANKLVGNTAANVLDGREGADTMIGGLGNDTYYVDDSRDRVVEAADGGLDRIYTTTSYNLGSSQVEFIEMLGTDNSRLIGNTLNNYIAGNSGDNFINGREGLDTLSGGDGWDEFIFNTALASSNVDLILDFETRKDVIKLDTDIFTELSGQGRMSAAQFAYTSDGNATSGSQRIIYDQTSGAVFYDADGNGAGAKVQFARVSLFMTDLSSFDFIVS